MTGEEILGKLKEIENRLKGVESDVNRAQGDINTLARLEKEDRVEQIKKMAEREFGRSKNRRKVWYYCNGERKIKELAEVTGIDQKNVRTYLTELNNSGLLVKEEKDGNVYYDKCNVYKGVGIKGDIEEEVDDL